MHLYRLAGQNFRFPCSSADLEPFKISAEEMEENMFVSSSFPGNEYLLLISRTKGWVGNAQRGVEVYSIQNGMLLKIEGCSEFFIAPHGESICRSGLQPDALSQLDREALLGPALVLALAMRSTWSLHSSAAMFKTQNIAFVGESGRGKSTLAAYLDSAGWQRVADDILPVTFEETGVQSWPHFPQLKLPPDKQPGLNFPEQLPLDRICVLASTDENAEPELELLPPNQAIQVLLSHTAGTRLFDPKLLEKHLNFCAQAAEKLPVYRLAYPHRSDALPAVKELLEKIC